MRTRTRSVKAGQHRLIFPAVVAITLHSAAPAAFASGFSSYYPYALDADMPDAAEAKSLLSATPWILRPFRLAHQESMQRGWNSVLPTQPVTQHNTNSGHYPIE